MQFSVKSKTDTGKNFKKNFGKKGRSGKNKIIFSVVLVFICVLIAATLTTRVLKRKRLQALEISEKTDPAIPVKVTEARYQDISSYVRSTAVIQAWQEAIISSEVSGKVKSLYAKVGDRLEPGDPILKLDDEMLRYRLEEAEARILQLEANHSSSKNDLKRQEKLFEEKVVSLYDLEQARAKEKSDRGLLASAQASLKIAKRDLRETLVKSPFRGVLAERFVALGSNVINGQKIASLVDIDKVKITIGATEKDMAAIRLGQSAEITTKVAPDKIYTGSVYSMGMKADDTTLTFPIEIVVENNQPPLLKPGMVAMTAIKTAEHTGVIAVPREILTRGSDSYFVWSVRENRAQKVMVDPGAFLGSQVIIKKGIPPATVLVTFGFENLFNGSRVKIIE